MRCLLGLGLTLVGCAASAMVGCHGGSFPPDADGGFDEAGPGDERDDGGTQREGGLTDARPAEGGSADGGLACGQLGGTYDGVKACNTASDCTTVARSCYCGAQPVIGISKSASAAATACEAMAGSQCALGCANFPGRMAEDGANDGDGGAIEVLCDAKRCHTVLR
jgi:hypothetical protein